jgi:hypothetical protein
LKKKVFCDIIPHGLTVSLAECGADTILWLLGISYDLTKQKNKEETRGFIGEENKNLI